jgi:hypothetical protein
MIPSREAACQRQSMRRVYGLWFAPRRTFLDDEILGLQVGHFKLYYLQFCTLATTLTLLVTIEVRT